MTRLTTLIAATAMLGLASCARRATTTSVPLDPLNTLTEGFDATVRQDVEKLRAATDKYHDMAAATAAGYPSKLPACIADSTMGGMGHHYIDRTLFDEKLEIERPEMLIYAPDGEGRVELVAVEYVVPYRAVPATDKAPRLFGQELKRYDQFNYWSLHVWAWRKNAAGLFADWNPDITC